MELHSIYFYIWVLSRRVKFPRFIHVVSFISNLQVVVHCMNILQCVYSPVIGHLSCFQFLSIRSKTTVDLFVQGFLWTVFISHCTKQWNCSCWNRWILYASSRCITWRKTQITYEGFWPGIYNLNLVIRKHQINLK